MPPASAPPMSLCLAPAAADQTAPARAPNIPVLPTHASYAAWAPLMPACEMLQEPAGHSVQFSRSVMSNSLWHHGLQHARPPLSITNSWSLLKLMSVELVMPSNHLILCHPLFFLPSIFPSIRVFSNESALCIRWPKYWSFSFSISPSNEYSGLVSFSMDSLDLLAVQGTLKSLLQHHSWKASILWHSAFFIVQLTHPYMTTGKTIALTRWTFVGKVMSLLFSMLSRLVIAFLPRSWAITNVQFRNVSTTGPPLIKWGQILTDRYFPLL